MKQLVKKTLCVALLTLVGLSAWADEKVTVTIPDNFEGGEIVEKRQDVGADGSTVVTITVTPANGYQISIGDIKVVASVPAQTRADEEASEGEEMASPAGPAIDDQPLTLTYVPADGDEENATDVADKTKPRDYQFTVPSGYGAIVQEANFTEAPKPTPEPGPTAGALSDDVSWNISSVADSDSKTLTISGVGEATLGERTNPWASYVDQIDKIVFSKEITSISADIFDGFTSALKIELENEDQPVVVTGEWPDGLTVTADVPGHLFNAYQLAESWKSQAIESSTGTPMPGIAFGEENDYAAFVSSQALRIPSVLKAYVATGIENNVVQISEILDGIIPADTPVFLYSDALLSTDVRTSSATSDGSATQSVLEVAPTGGLVVGVGEVYILYRDKFYLTQAGTLPAGRVYLPVSALSNTNTTSQARLSLSRGTGNGTDGATAISTVSASAPAADVWYCLDGRRLNGAPTKKGVYIHNGRKAIVK